MKKNDIELLRGFLINSPLNEECNTSTGFSKANDFYFYTNEHLKDYYCKDLKDKKVLSVTSSGDHILHAIYAGATDITAFDVNIFCKYYAALKIAIMKHYNRTSFFDKIENFKSIGPGRDNWYLKDFSKTIHKVSKLLTEEELVFWNEYISICKKNKFATTFYNISTYRDRNIYYNEDTYKKLKKKLFDANINYVDCDIAYLNKTLDDKYDFMYISNILNYLDDGAIVSLLINLSEMFNECGKIYIPGDNPPCRNSHIDKNSLSKYYDIDDSSNIKGNVDAKIVLTKL